ncbi:MAG: S9 family peptidase [Acidobacteriaceae bacterium]
MLRPAIASFLSIACTCAVSQNARTQSAQQQPKTIQQLTIRDLWKQGGLTGRAPETIKWSPDGTKVSYILRDESGERGELWYIDTGTAKSAVLVAADKLAGLAPPNTAISNPREQERRARYGVAGYHWAPDSKHLLFDSKGQLWYFRLDTGTATQMTTSSEAQQDPKFSPDGHFISYVKKHQLYVKGIDRAQEKEHGLTTARETAPRIRLDEAKARGTKREQEDTAQDKEDKLEDDILNGEVDWVYGEELGVRSNYFWSPDSRQIAFLQMDETSVPVYPIEDFIPKHPTVDFQKYPKAGDNNPGVRIGVVSRDGGRVRWLEPPKQVADWKEWYVPRFGWVNATVVYAMYLNRKQNTVELVFTDMRDGQSRVVLEEKSDPFLEIDDCFRILRSGDRFLWSSWRDGHTHLYLYSFDKANPARSEATLVNQITKGDFEVQEVHAVDEQSGIIYYESNEASANGDQFAAWRERNLVARKLDGTLLWILGGGTKTASFGPSDRYFVQTQSSYMRTPEMQFCTATPQEARCVKPFFKSRQITFEMTEPKWLQLKAEDGTPLEGMLLLPRVAEGQKVPVILNPYGGPHGQVVRDTWGGSNAAFDQILLRDGFAVLKVDNRGMGERGKKFASITYQNLGEVELKDQLAALDQTIQQFPQLDASRVGWWGWSYGGFMTLYAMTHSDRIKAGFAGAPVSNWEMYDSVYTERYMWVPKQNPEGYQKSAPANAAKNLQGVLAEAHGTSDDNVHMQNTIQWIQALIDADKQYSLLLYPRKTHGVTGEAARTQLYERIEKHFLDNLK